MKKLKAKDLRLKSKADLLKEVSTISKDLMRLRLLQAEDNINNKNHVFYTMRKNISRILTILSEKDNERNK
jgi:ribosomal protein L29